MAPEGLSQEDEVRGGDRLLLELVGEMELVLLVDHRRERDVVVRDLEERGDFLEGRLDPLRDLLRGGRPLELAAQGRLGLADAVEEVRLLLRQPEGPALVGEGVDDRLAHPPDGVGDELDVLAGVVALRRLDEADVPLVDEVEERHAAAAVALGVGDDEAEVRLDELAEGLLVPLLDLAPEDPLVLGRDPGQPRDLLEILLEGFGAATAGFLAFVFHRLPGSQPQYSSRQRIETRIGRRPASSSFVSETVSTPSTYDAATESRSTCDGRRNRRMNFPYERSTRWNCSPAPPRPIARSPWTTISSSSRRTSMSFWESPGSSRQKTRRSALS